jgi:hypothetical protein
MGLTSTVKKKVPQSHLYHQPPSLWIALTVSFTLLPMHVFGRGSRKNSGGSQRVKDFIWLRRTQECWSTRAKAPSLEKKHLGEHFE